RARAGPSSPRSCPHAFLPAGTTGRGRGAPRQLRRPGGAGLWPPGPAGTALPGAIRAAPGLAGLCGPGGRHPGGGHLRALARGGGGGWLSEAPHDHHGHTHPHPHQPDLEDGPFAYHMALTEAVAERLLAKGVISADELRRTIEHIDSLSPALGAAVV